MNITTALKLLDPRDDEHWTTDGSPRLDVLSDLLAAKVTRKQVTDAAPNFTRESALADETEDDETETGLAPIDPPDEQLTKSTDDEPDPEPKMESDTPPQVEVATDPLSQARQQLKVLTNEMDEASQDMTVAKDRFQAASDAVNSMNRRIEVMVKTDPNHATKGVRDYIAKSNATREDKARKLQAFTDMVEASPDELAKKLGLRSPLDNALRGRKTPRAIMNR